MKTYKHSSDPDILEAISSLSINEAEGFQIDKLRILKSNLLEDIKGARRALELREFARAIWGEDLQKTLFDKYPLMSLAQFYYNDCDTVQDFAERQIWQEEQRIREAKTMIEAQGAKLKSLHKFYSESIDAAEKQIELIQKALTEYRALTK